MTVLVISTADDPVARGGVRRLRERGVDVVEFDPRELATTARVTVRWSADGASDKHVVTGGRGVPLVEVHSVWHRRQRVASAPAIVDPARRAFVEAETERLLRYLWSDLGAAFLPAPITIIQDGQDKLFQLGLAGRLGFEVPPTIVTNDPGEALAFLREHGCRCVTKHIATPSMRAAGLTQEFARFTEPVTYRDVAALDAVRLAPTLLQAYVDKRVELRVTVVGDRVFAAEIHSQVAAHTRHDWRKYDFGTAVHRVHVLPAAVAARCVAITRALGLHYGALDLVLTPDDRYVFLEINPAGEYEWIEGTTGMPITDAICDLLVELAAERGEA